MINLHHLTNSLSQRVIWLLEELGIEYKLIIHERHKKTRRAPESLYKAHSLGKAPVLIDKTLELAETGAIFDYLLENYDQGRFIPPAHSPAKIYYFYWKNFAEASLMPYLAMTQVFARIKRNTPFFLKPIVNLIVNKINSEYLRLNLRAETDLIEQHLANNEWFAGDQFTAADILMGFMLDALAERFITLSSHPHIYNYVTEMKKRPAYQRANIKGQWSADEFNLYWSHLKTTS